MMRFSSLIKSFGRSFIQQYQHKLSYVHRQALNALRNCRSQQGVKMLTRCMDCDEFVYVPHSCGHRNCPHCQHHEGEQWLQRQLQKQVPAEYFLVTFTLPAQFRGLVWFHQRVMYAKLMACCWETLRSFSLQDRDLKGVPGAIAVLHTHARDLSFHPHVHVVMPAAAIQKEQRLWRKKPKNPKGKTYLFNHKALAKVFRAKMLDAVCKAGLFLPAKYPEEWVVDCRSVGSGEKALIYLGRYLYRGVIQEKDIVRCEDGYVTFRYREWKTGKYCLKTVTGEAFLWLVLQHVLPKGFRRARNYGFLHPNSKSLLAVLQLKFGIDPRRALGWLKKRPVMRCRCCGGEMKIIKTRIIPNVAGSGVPMVPA